jgi:3-deoxy-7-phosphoheptulonate synthase
MIIVLKKDARPEEAQEVIRLIEERGLEPLHLPGVERVVIGALGDERCLHEVNFLAMPFVDEVKPVLSEYKRASRDFQSHDSLISVGSVQIGGEALAIAAGPCSVESQSQIEETAQAVAQAGASLLRGGAYKPRTSPYSFQGLGREALPWLSEAGRRSSLPVVTELMDVTQIDVVCEHADMIQIGARNMQNFTLLKAAGATLKPILLKRGPAATLDELLLAAEYVFGAGNDQIVLCERGIRGFDAAYRNVLDLNAIPYLKRKTHLPVIVDPSHGTGHRDLVGPMACAAIAAGADGLIIEVHPCPKEAKSDAQQQLTPVEFKRLMTKLRQIAEAVGRTVP